MSFKTPYSFFDDAANRFPGKLAISYKDKQYTYHEFQVLVNRIKNFFIKNNSLQEVVGLYMENSDYWLATYFGILGAGSICCPFDHRFSSDSMVQKIKFTNPKYLVVSKKFWPKMKRENIGRLTKIILIDDLIQKELGNPTQQADLEQAKYSSIMFTSGTTKKPKAIRLPSSIVYDVTDNIIECLKIKPDDIYYAVLPFSHSFGIGNVHTTLKVGGQIVVADNTINLKKVLAEIASHKATFFAATPLTLKMIVENFLDEFILAGETLRIICTNTGPMDPPISRKIIKNLKKTNFYTYYGLTEASRATFLYFNLNPEKLESVGKSAPNVVVKVVKDNFEETAPFELGEIFIKGNNVISEYWNNPQETNQVFVKCGMLTGDIGYYDRDGFLFVEGRKDDLINMGGEKFSLLEVDKTIKEVDKVEEAATIVEADKLLGQSLKSFVVLKEKSVLNVLEIKENKSLILTYCKKKLESYKIPHKIQFVDSLPKTESGKLKRQNLI